MPKRRKARSVRRRPAERATIKRLKLPRVEITPDRQWYVVRTLPRMEFRASEELQMAGMLTYLPVMVEETVKKGARVETPRYPAAGYVFLGSTLAEDALNAVAGSQSAIDLIKANDGLARVPSVDLQQFADNLTLWNENVRCAQSTGEARAIIVRGLETLGQAFYSLIQDKTGS